jgi:hypothetical protein
MAARKKKAPDNAEEISRLRRKKMLTLSLFFGSIALIPLSCGVCCGPIPFIPNETVKAVFGISGFVGPIIGLVGVILMWSDRHRYGRGLDLALLADEWDMSFTETPPEEQLDLVRSFQAFRDPTKEVARYCLVGIHDDRSVVIVEYSCSWVTERATYVKSQTAIVFEGAVPEIPDLVVYPKSVVEKLADAVGLPGDAVKVPKQDKFNKKFTLYADKAIRATACFSPTLAALCVEEGDVVLEANGGNLLVYWLETYISAADLPDRLAIAGEVVQSLSDAG